MEDALEPSGIEMAKVLREVRAVTDNQKFEQIHRILGPPDHEHTARAIEGLSQESEFALMSTLMGTAVQMASLDQTPFLPGNHITGDFIASFRPSWASQAFPCVVEVKSTKKPRFQLSAGTADRYRAFARGFNLPLLFAIRFMNLKDQAVWTMLLDSGSGPVDIELKNAPLTLRSVLWDELGYILNPQVRFCDVYGPISGDTFVIHPEHGSLRAFVVTTAEGMFRFDGHKGALASSFCEQFGLVEERVVQHAQGRIVVHSRPQFFFRTMADMLLGMVRLPRGEEGQVLDDPLRLLRQMGSKSNPPLITKQMVEDIARLLEPTKAIYYALLADPADMRQVARRLGFTPACQQMNDHDET